MSTRDARRECFGGWTPEREASGFCKGCPVKEECGKGRANDISFVRRLPPALPPPGGTGVLTKPEPRPPEKSRAREVLLAVCGAITVVLVLRLLFEVFF